MDGVSGRELFKARQSLTYNDIIVLPGHIDFGTHDVSLRTRLTREIELNAPLTSSPMDTVTESDMAISLALIGGLGFIHYNNSIEDQVAEVRKVKRFENGFITDPIVLGPENTLHDVDNLKEKHGFSGVPITEDGVLGGRLIGIVTNRDIDFESNRDIVLKEVMTTQLVTAHQGVSLTEANRILKDSKKGKLPIVDANGGLVSLVCRTDLKKNRDFPGASKNKKKQLMVGAERHHRSARTHRLRHP